MNIAQIRQLDIGMKGIACSGKVTWVNEAKNIVGTSGAGNDYDFWSQFIVIKDDTDKIGVSVTIESDERSVRKGEIITIENAELQEYIKDGKSNLKLQGKVRTVSPQNTQQAPSPPAQPTNYQQPVPHYTSQGKKEPDWDAKDLRMARMNSVTNSTKLICLMAEVNKDIDITGKDRERLVNLVTQTADIILHYIYNGLTKKQVPDSNQSVQNNPIEAQFCDECRNLKEECTCNPSY